MSNINFTIDFNGAPNRDDRAAALLVVNNENQRLLDADPNATLLPTGTPPELKASYLEVLLAIVTRAHSSYVDQAAEKDLSDRDVIRLLKNADDATRDAVVALLNP